MTYEAVDTRDPGQTSSVTQALPSTPRRSRTSVRTPAPARCAAQTSPLCPAPMTIASWC